VDPFTRPQRPASEPGGRSLSAPLAVVALIVAMVALSIAGSAMWRPEARDRATLPLGGARPVGNSNLAAGETIAGVLDQVAPTVAFLTIPELARSGSGVVVHESGFVVTNAHVVEGVANLRVAFDDGEEYDAVVFGVDRSTDLAVVKVDAGRPLQAAPLGDSNELHVGEFVLALGAPFGLEATATSGIVSGLHRSGLGIARFEDFIVTDAPINRGNSGGPLVNLRGEVVGINTAIIADEDDPQGLGTFAGIGFAIPVNIMRVVAQRLIGDGHLEVAAMGSEVGDLGAAGASVMTVARRDAGLAESVAPAARQAYEASVGYVEVRAADGTILGHGSGFVALADDVTLFVTNEHVVRGARLVTVFFPGRRGMPAEVLAVEEQLDLALLSLPADDTLVALPIGDADEEEVGGEVTAVGARESDGAISLADNAGTLAEIGVQRQGFPTEALILATTARVMVGDSGGPLIDRRSDLVIGLMMARDTRDTAGGGAHSFAVALRADTEMEKLMQLAADPGASLGFTPFYPRDGRRIVVALGVGTDSPAGAAGLRNGDRITRLNGEDVPPDEPSQRAMMWQLLRLSPGTEVAVAIERGTGEDPREELTFSWRIPQRPPVP